MDTIVKNKEQKLELLINKYDAGSVDYLVNSGDFSLETDYRDLYINDNQFTNKLRMNENALQQLCAKITVPYTFIKKSMETGYSGIAEEARNVLHTWLEYKYDPKTQLLVRAHDNYARAILSDRYKIVNSIDVFNLIKDNVLPKGYHIKEYHHNEGDLYMRVINNERIDIPGEDLHIGFNIKNGETGNLKLSADVMVFKQICSNGLMVTKGQNNMYNKRHFGNIDAGSMVTDFTNHTINNISTITRQVKDEIVKAMNESIKIDNLDAILKKVSTETKVVGSAMDVVRNLLDKYGMTQWGLVNSITEVAQQYDIDRREKLESYAYQLIGV
jgi:hypothetical protein